MEASVEEFKTSGSAERLYAAGGVAAIVAGGTAVWYFDPTTAGFFPVCPLFAMTGFACPGCGMTRGFHALFHGDIVTALDFNALIPLMFLFFGYWFLSMLLVAVRGRGFGFGNMSLGLVIGTFALLLVFGVLRNIPVYPFTVLFP